MEECLIGTLGEIVPVPTTNEGRPKGVSQNGAFFAISEIPPLNCDSEYELTTIGSCSRRRARGKARGRERNLNAETAVVHSHLPSRDGGPSRADGQAG